MIEILRVHQIDPTATKQAAELLLDINDFLSGRVPRLKLDEDVHITIRAKIVANCRSKHRKASDMVTLAKVSNYWRWK